MSPSAELKARGVLDNTRRVAAIELICAAQGIDFRGSSRCRKGTRAAYGKICEKVLQTNVDRPTFPDIEFVAEMIRDGSLIRTVESLIGKLTWDPIFLLFSGRLHCQ